MTALDTADRDDLAMVAALPLARPFLPDIEGERVIPGPGNITPARWSIAVDFDGVIHQHVSPWTGDPAHIPDPPVPGAIAFLTAMVERYDVFIFTCRLLTPRRSPVERAMCAWLASHGAPEAVIHALHFASEKPHAGVYLDDRAMRFEGSFPTVAAIDAHAVPWNKRPAVERACAADGAVTATASDREEHAAGEVSVEEAREMLCRFVRSHFRNHDYEGRERARFSIPANPLCDDDIRLGAFISRAEKAFAKVDQLRRTVHELRSLLADYGVAEYAAGFVALPLTSSVMCACLANDGVPCPDCVERAQAAAP